MSRWIDVPSKDGRWFSAYLATPPRTAAPQRAPGLVVIQEIWGVNAHIRAVADQYASDGFVVLAPDVFWRLEPRVDLGYDEGGTAKAFGLRKGVDLALADDDIAATVTALRGLEGADGKVAAVGYCMGGMLAYRAAAAGSIDCAIAYYGGGIQQQLDLAPSVRVPIEFHYGGKDTHIPPEAVASVRAAFASRDDVEVHSYPAADHGFNCWARPSYDRRAATLAHGRSLAFLATHLG